MALIGALGEGGEGGEDYGSKQARGEGDITLDRAKIHRETIRGGGPDPLGHFVLGEGI